jgi:DNA-binding NarL/FixJ family response regulator
MTPIRVVLADDHNLLRAGIDSLLDNLEGIEVVARAANAIQALELAISCRPDILLTDIAMPGGPSGLELAAQLAVDCPNVRVIFLTMYNDAEYVRHAAAIGASGYLLKDADESELELALRAVARGESYFTPSVAEFLNQASPSTEHPAATPTDELTPRQIEVLRMIAHGQATKSIARALGVSSKTVESHRTQLMSRLQIHNVAGLVRHAIRIGLIKPEE